MRALNKTWIWLLAALSIFCVVIRLLRPEDIGFWADIPHFQILLDEYRSSGKFPLISFRGSSTYVAYGGGALWCYALIRSFVSSMEGIALAHILVYSLSAFGFLWLLRDRLDRKLSWLVVWLCLSSPHLFYHSRIIWDSGFFIPLSLGLLCCLDHLDRLNLRSWLAWVLIGLLASHMANTHLMSVPLLIAVAITACILIWRSELPVRDKLVFPGIALLVFLATFTPYLVEAWRIYKVESVGERSSGRTLWGDGRNLWWLLQRTLLYPGTYAMKVIFGDDFSVFVREQGILGGLIRRDYFGWPPKLLALGMILRLSWEGIRRKKLNGMELVTAITFFSVILVLNLLDIPTEPHYFQATWWLPFLALAICLGRLKGRIRTGAVLLVAICAIVNTLFSFGFYRYIRDYHGIRLGRYGPAYVEYRNVTESVCSSVAGDKVVFDLSEVRASIYPFKFFLNRLDECKGKKFEFSSEPQVRRVKILFADPHPYANFGWERIGPGWERGTE